MRRSLLLFCALLAAGCNKSITSRVDPYTGELEIVEWRDDRRHGLSQHHDHDDVLREEARFEHGMRTGLRTRWHANGAREREQHYVRGLRHGPELGWHANGALAYEGDWIEGDRAGTWTYYAADGRPEREEDWELGTLGAVRVSAAPRSGGD
jgi:antitoxin component YwqK of YwqJK toxin-antitoxin module